MNCHHQLSSEPGVRDDARQHALGQFLRVGCASLMTAIVAAGLISGFGGAALAQDSGTANSDGQAVQTGTPSMVTPTSTTEETKNSPSDDAPGTVAETKDVPAADAQGAQNMPASDGASAVVFMYHRFNEPKYPSTNIRPEQFEAHLKELGNGTYHVMKVEDIIDAIKSGKSLPDRAIGITIDDAYRSVYTFAWPLFKKAHMPFTVFVSTNQLDAGYESYMTWDMLRELVKAGVTVGGHSDHHDHLSSMPIEQVRQELKHSAERFKQELGFVPDLFAYPYGEADTEVQKAVKDAGYKAAFGQQSGGFDGSADMYYLPRFALNEHYGEQGRFELAANSLPLDVSDVTPADYTLKRNPPAFGFTLKHKAPGLKCYPSAGQATMTRLGESRVEVRLDGPLDPGRWRINCTSLGPDQRWHWFGMLYTVPKG